MSNYHKIESSNFYSRCNLCSEEKKGPHMSHSLDELALHMLSDHNSSAFICYKKPCDRVGLNGFETEKLLKAHIKKDHPSPFQCTHPGCDRVGSKGWLREKDQKKHMLKKHEISY